MPGLGRNIGDAYIEVHASTGPFRRDMRREARAAGDESGHEFDRSFGARLGKLNIGLSSLKGSRNNFLNIIGSMAQGLENAFGKGLRETFAVLGSSIAGFGRTIAQAGAPLEGLGNALDRFGLAIGRLGGGGIDGLIIQIVALVTAFEAMLVIAGTAAAGISLLVGALTALTVAVGGGLLGFVTALGPAMLALAAGTGAASFAIAGMNRAQKRALAPLKEWVKEIQGIANEALFDDIGKQVRGLADALSTSLNPLIERSAGVLREFVDGFVASIQGGGFANVMGILSAQLPNLLRNTLSIVSNLATGLTGIFAGAAPGANRLFEAINRVTGSFAEWFTSTEGMAQVNRFMGDAIPILNTLWDIAKQVGNTLRILWEEGASGGKQLLDSVSSILTQFTAWLGSTEGRAALTQWFNDAVIAGRQLGNAVRAVVDLFNALDTQQTRDFFGTLVTQVTASIGALTMLVTWTQSVVTWFQNLGPAIGDTFATAGRAISTWVAGAVAGFNKFATTASVKFQAFNIKVGNVFNGIAAVARNVFNTINNIQVAAITGIINAWNRLKSIGSAALVSIKSLIGTLTAPLRAVVAGIQLIMIRFGGLRGIASAVLGQMRANIATAIGAVTNFIGAIVRVASSFGRLGSAAAQEVGRIISAFRSIDLYSMGVNIISGLINGISARVGTLLSYARSIASQIASAFASALDMASPSKVFRSFGGFIVEGLIDGMQRRERDAVRQSDSLAQGVIRGAVAGLERQRGFLRAAADQVSATLAGSGRSPRVSSAFEELGRRSIIALTNGLSRGRDAAQGDVRSIIERIGELAREAMEGENRKTRASIAAQARGLQEWVVSQGRALDAVWREVDRAGARLTSARERLKELQDQFNQLRDSTAESLRGELNLGSTVVDGETTFEAVAANVSGLAAKMRTFASMLKQLVAAGLPAALVQEVASLGTTEGIAVARALLSGTTQQREALVADFASLQASTSQIGTILAEQMFGAGIEAQKGLIEGLEANREALIQAAKRIAETIAAAVRRELGIRSPSTVFRQIGEFITEGLAQGIDAGKRRVDSAITGLVDPDTIANLNPSLSALGAQGSATGSAGAGGTSIAAGAIQVVSPFANPRLVALEVMDALAARGK